MSVVLKTTLCCPENESYSVVVRPKNTSAKRRFLEVTSIAMGRLERKRLTGSVNQHARRPAPVSSGARQANHLILTSCKYSRK